MRTLFICVFLCIASIGYAQAPQKDGASQQGAGNAKSNKAAPKQPVEVKLLNTGKSKEESAQETARIASQESTERWTIGLTIGLVVATVLQFFALVWQGCQLKRTVHMAYVESRPVLAPWVIDMEQLHELHEPGVVFNGTHKFPSRVSFVFENYGKSPALVRQVRAQLRLVSERIPKVNWEKMPIRAYQESVPAEMRSDQVKGAAAHVDATFELTSDQLNELLAEAEPGKKIRRVYLFVLVVYDDLYGMRQASHFCRKLRLAEGIRFQAQHGGAKYNFTKTTKIPKWDDPMDTATV